MPENSFSQQVKQAQNDIIAIQIEMSELDAIIVKASEHARKLGSSFKITTPDGMEKVINSLNTSMTKLNATLEKQITNTGNLANKKKQLQTYSDKEKIELRAIKREYDLQYTATSKLVGAYGNLIAQRKIAANNLRNLISSEKASTAEINKAKKAHEQLTDRVNKANKATSNFSKTGIGSMVRGLKNLAGAFGVMMGANLVASLVKNIFSLTKKLQSLDFALRKIVVSQKDLARTQAFLSDITKRFGADIITTTERYIKFVAAAQQSGVSLAKTEKIFSSVTKAAGALGLKTDELTGIYLALEQMLSKGKVTTEELRRQLGERLPGAFGIMANAIGVTVSELDKMLRSGEVLSSDALPKFAAALEAAYGIENVNNIDTIVAAQTRLNNSWVEFVKIFSGEKGGNGVMYVFDALSNFMTGTTERLEVLLFTFDSGTTTVESFQLAMNYLSKGFKNIIPYMDSSVGLFEESTKRIIADTEARRANAIEINKQMGSFIALNKTIRPFPKGQEEKAGDLEVSVFTTKAPRTKNVVEEELKAQKKLLQESTAIKSGAIKEAIALLEEELKAWGKLTKETKDAKEGSLGFFESQINLLKSEQKNLAVNSDEYNEYADAIEKATKMLEALKRAYGISDGESALNIKTLGINDAKTPERDVSKTNSELIDSGFNLTDFDGLLPKIEGANSALERMTALLDMTNLKGEFVKGVFGEVSETFAEIFDIDISKFDFLFDSAEKSITDWAQLSKELIGSVLDASLNKYEIELQEAQRSRDLIIDNELSTVKQKRLANQKFEREERRIKTERAKAERTNNLIKIAADTAVGIATAAATYLGNPITAPAFPGIAALILGTGLTQAGIVAAQPIPKFAEGHLSGTHKGKALINDANRSDYKEVIERGNGQVEVYKDRNQLIDMKRGDKVHKSENSFLTHHDITRDIMNMSMRNHSEQLGQFKADGKIVGELSEMSSNLKDATKRMEALGRRKIHVENTVIVEQPYDKY